MKVTHRSAEAGFTLAEALIAIVILVFGLMAITNLMVVGTTSTTAANHSTAATALASQKLEELKAQSFSVMAIGGDIDADSDANFRQDTTVSGVGTFRTTWEIRQIDRQVLYVRVRSESRAPLITRRSRAEFTTFRTCAEPPFQSSPTVGQCPTL